MRRRHALLTGALACLAFPLARAQPQAVRLVVPYPPGGPLDSVARALAERVRVVLGSVIVENRPGAGGNIGADAVAKAAPDGNTLVMGAVATHAINPWLHARLPYHPIQDFTPITGVAQVPNVLVINPAAADRLGVRSVAELVAYARSHPGQLNYGSGGNGSAGHLAGEMFKARTGAFMVHIPYAGGNPAQLALIAGQVDLSFDNLAAAAANIKAGRLRALAVSTARRSSAMPELPTLAESLPVLAGLDINTWFGIFGPAGLSPEVTARLNQAFVEALASPEVVRLLASLLAEAMPSKPEAFAAFVKNELAKYEVAVKASGAKID